MKFLSSVRMRTPDWLPGLVLVLGITLITMNFWYHKTSKEGFQNADVNLMTYEVLKKANQPEEEKPPTDDQMAISYRAMLLYIKSDFPKGLKFVYDLNQRIYGKYTTVPDSFDPRKLLNDYKNPLTGI